MIDNNYLYSDLTAKIIGCSYEVHRQLGNGFQEKIYQRALAFEFNASQLQYIMEMTIPIYYKDVFIGNRRVDFYVEDKIMVELKAVKQLEDVHLAQAINYLEIYRKEVGLLINFGSKKLEFKRVMKKFDSNY